MRRSSRSHRLAAQPAASIASANALITWGYEVIQFHASGVGGKSLERLAASGELAGVVDITTHELRIGHKPRL
jgi:uncharacterized protein (UPF0261 family)